MTKSKCITHFLYLCEVKAEASEKAGGQLPIQRKLAITALRAQLGASLETPG